MHSDMSNLHWLLHVSMPVLPGASVAQVWPFRLAPSQLSLPSIAPLPHGFEFGPGTHIQALQLPRTHMVIALLPGS